MNEFQIEKLLYSMGKTFNGLSATRLSTNEFLRTNNPEALDKKSDLLLLRDLQDATRYMLALPTNATFDHLTLANINKQMTRTAAMLPGHFRTKQSISVWLMDGSEYVPAVPKVKKIDHLMHKIDAQKMPQRAASQLFVELAKIQPFGDGNKRTAALASNFLLRRHNIDDIFTVPTSPDEVKTFNILLSKFYRDHTLDIIDFLTEYNTKDSSNPTAVSLSNINAVAGDVYVHSHERNGIHIHSYVRHKKP